MTITRLGETKKGRFSVFADGEFLFSVHKDIFLSRKELELGREVSVELLEEIRLEDEAYSCKEKALTLLEYSAHSAGRLAEKLRRFYPPETVDITIERLGELGDAAGWTLEEMMGFIDSNPDSTVFSADAGQLLEYSLVFNQSHFVDWEAHTCDFTSDEFIRLLEFCGRFSDRKGTEGAEVLDMMERSNIALLHEVELVRPQDIAMLAQILGTEDISYVGFPTVDGRAGSLLEDCGGTCAISAKSKHKEQAWAFVELLLTGWENPPKSPDSLEGTKGFPTELGTRERYFAKVSENPYRIGEDGEIIMEGGKPMRYAYHTASSRTMQVFFYTPLPEETELICALLDSSTTARGGRQISSIVAQEAQGYFSGQKSAADVAALIQNRVSMYLAEQE